MGLRTAKDIPEADTTARSSAVVATSGELLAILNASEVVAYSIYPD